MSNLYIETPTLLSEPLSLTAGKPVWLKLEALQPSGSFKLRGVSLLCQQELARGARGFVSSSGGNAGIAVAYVGRKLGVPVRVVVPETTSEVARQLIRAEGAELIVHGESWFEANAYVQESLAGDEAFIHPFDHPLLWQGHSSLIDEVVQCGIKPSVVVLSVGGGGLLCGAVEGMQRVGWHDVPVLAMETEGAESFAAARAAGRAVRLPAITSIASSLGARQVCDQALTRADQHPVISEVVSDAAALIACERLLQDHRLLVEPACGAALAAVTESSKHLQSAESILVIVCGGVTMTDVQMRQLLVD
ncbi:MAG: pyridoxal-phosphate dependent enzyme [Pseudomonadota bacterium]|nr:pyridoxal-phosphate dependent enzyme [Pseudomonadota bacterium]